MEVRRRNNRPPGPRGDSGSPAKRARTKSQSVDSGFTTVIAVAFVAVLGGAAVFLFAPGVKNAVFARSELHVLQTSPLTVTLFLAPKGIVLY